MWREACGPKGEAKDGTWDVDHSFEYQCDIYNYASNNNGTVAMLQIVDLAWAASHNVTAIEAYLTRSFAICDC